MTKQEKGGLALRPAAQITTKLALAALLASTASSAYAKEYELGEGVSATTSISLQAGVAVRTEDAHRKVVNGANGAPFGITGLGRSGNDDDANLNYERGDIVSAPITVLGEVDFNFNDKFGFFLRGKAVSDLALEFLDVRHGHSPNGYQPGERLDDQDFTNLAKFTHAAVLDAFLYTDFEIADKPVNFRLGRQVVSWGEGIFIQGGVNVINPFDVPAFRRPGTQLKEGLLPVGMAYTNVGLTDDLSFEAFLQFEYQEIVLDGCGTFFSTSDIAAEGCDIANLTPGGVYLEDDDPGDSDAMVLAGTGALTPGANPFGTLRKPDVRPDDFSVDQFGAALRYYSPYLDTEFGVYYHHLHNRIPIVGGVINLDNYVAPIPDGMGGFALPPNANHVDYAVEYTQDIDTFGFSAATEIFGASWGFEAAYRPNHDIQINGSDGLTTAVALGAGGRPTDALWTGENGFFSLAEEVEQFTAQINTIWFFDQLLGASRYTVIAEAGMERLLLDPDDLGLNYGRAFAYGTPTDEGGQEGGLITDFSWGYRVFIQGDYPNWMNTGLNFKPSFVWVHDVEGESSHAQYYDNRKGISLGAQWDYLQTYTFRVDYTNFFDGFYFTSTDRDFASATIRAEF